VVLAPTGLTSSLRVSVRKEPVSLGAGLEAQRESVITAPNQAPPQVRIRTSLRP